MIRTSSFSHSPVTALYLQRSDPPRASWSCPSLAQTLLGSLWASGPSLLCTWANRLAESWGWAVDTFLPLSQALPVTSGGLAFPQTHLFPLCGVAKTSTRCRALAWLALIFHQAITPQNRPMSVLLTTGPSVCRCLINTRWMDD